MIIFHSGKGDNSFILYAGPKEADRLESYNVSLEKIINYGWFSFLARPLFKILKLFYKFTHNYGISIIILTVIIKAIFFPLSQKSFKSMKKMQKIQPELKIIQERYKNDKQKLSMEMMKHSFKPMIITLIPLLLLFWWVGQTFSTVLPKWIWYYIIAGIASSLIFRKLLKVV